MAYLRNNGPGNVRIEETTFPAFATFNITPNTTPNVIETRYLDVSLLSHLLKASRSMGEGEGEGKAGMVCSFTTKYSAYTAQRR
jgi:hypothetical protein